MDTDKFTSILVVFFIAAIALMIFCVGFILDQAKAQSSVLVSNKSIKDESHLMNGSKLNLDSGVSESIRSNPDFVFLDNKSGIVAIGTSNFWERQFSSCSSKYMCMSNFSTGWNDNTSSQYSSGNNNNETWSTTYGGEISVQPLERYLVHTHMKLNKWTLQSHIAIEGLNNTKWYQIDQCPHGIDGPLNWTEFRCNMTVPEGITKIRIVLNAGWSSVPKKIATTWFDSIQVIKSDNFIEDPNLRTEVVYSGLEVPTNMAFLGPNDILVLEKDKGTVQRIVNGVKLDEPLLDLEVAVHDGLTGIATAEELSSSPTGIDRKRLLIFLFFAAALRDGDDLKGLKPLGNYVDRYEFANNSLINPKRLLTLPAGSEHNGGEILMGPDNNLYISVGEVYTKNASKNKALNDLEGEDPDGRAGILQINVDGEPANSSGILGDEYPLNSYYAYGIRNIFGIDFDPVTGNLWDTENGPDFGDEVNLVTAGFNSGWHKIQGIWNVPGGNRASENPNNLVNFEGRGKYSEPEFTWNQTVGPTAIKFVTTDKLGKQYENDMFVADAKNGRIYDFNLSQNRTQILLEGPLSDKIANVDGELRSIVFAHGYGTITDMEIGPDGYLYFVSLDHGKIYRIIPGRQNENSTNGIEQIVKTSTSQLKELSNIVLNASVSKPDSNEVYVTNPYSNPEFVFFDNKTGLVNLRLPSFWKDQIKACESGFSCMANSSTGWLGNNSFQISTANNINNTFSSTYGQEIEVKPTERYQLVTHMKVNSWASESHIAMEGFNESQSRWYQIEQCPSGLKGPLDWEEFSCVMTIPMNTTKIRPVMHAGWSSQENKEAVTSFDAFYLLKLS